MYDWKGRWIEEPDDDSPMLRRHCVSCGAFLPKEPKTVEVIEPVDWEYQYDDQGELVGILVLSERKVFDWEWHCTRCGHDHDADDMYY